MTSTLSFLPAGKQAELAFVVETIRAGFAHATARRTMPRLRGAKLHRIILFGSYSRGDWVEDPKGRYFSDYDILCVVSAEEFTDWSEYWEKIERTLIEAEAHGERLRTPHSIIVHALDDVNEQLRLGRYFFIDIVRDGITLYSDDDASFAQPQPLTPAQALQETRDYFDEWFESAQDFLQAARDAQARERSKFGAFQLHQATERAYHCLLLVRTLYSPKTHRLNKLREMTEDLEPRLRGVWPKDSKFEKRCYALLQDAYVKGRYSRHYRIGTDELAWLVERVEMLLTIVERASHERLATLEAAA